MRARTALVILLTLPLLTQEQASGKRQAESNSQRSGQSVALIKELLLQAAESGRHAETLARLDELSRVASDAIDLHYGGAIAYEAAKRATAPQRGELLARGIALERAALAKSPESMESMVFLSLLLREQAALASPDSERNRLLADADEWSKKAKEVVARKQERLRLQNWTAEIVQDGVVNATAYGLERISTAVIEPRPFTIRVRISRPANIALNAMISDAAVTRIVPGFDLSSECFPEERSLFFPCSPTKVAIEPGSTRIFTGAERTNYLSSDPADGQWTRTARDGEDWLLERDVTEIDLKQIGTWSEQLYLVLLLEPENGVVEAEDIRRFLITFL